MTTSERSTDTDAGIANHAIPSVHGTGGERLRWSSQGDAPIDRDGVCRVPLRDGVLSFSRERYADNFGWQWNQYATT